jgi:hypothetical protein
MTAQVHTTQIHEYTFDSCIHSHSATIQGLHSQTCIIACLLVLNPALDIEQHVCLTGQHITQRCCTDALIITQKPLRSLQTYVQSVVKGKTRARLKVLLLSHVKQAQSNTTNQANACISIPAVQVSHNTCSVPTQAILLVTVQSLHASRSTSTTNQNNADSLLAPLWLTTALSVYWYASMG